MPFRVGEADIKGMITVAPRDEQGQPINLSHCIQLANVITDQISDNDDDGVMTDKKLAQIEKLLAIHFYTFRDQQYKSKSVDGASDNYQGDTGMYFESSFYGQTAKMMDSTGTLAEMERNARENAGRHEISMDWLGKSDSDRLSYYDRDTL